MKLYPGRIYHIYNRGNNHQKIFFERKNYFYFIQKMETHLHKHTDILAWCLMPNHFHWMIKVHDDYASDHYLSSSKNESDTVYRVPPLSRSISTLLSSYTKGVNKMYDRNGSLFQQKTKAIDLNSIDSSDEYYPIICFNYIHQNPLKARLVNRIEDYEFSSFRDYNDKNSDSICNLNLSRYLLDLPKSYEKFLNMSYRMIPEDLSDKLF